MMHYAFKHKTDFMKAIQNAVARGYTRYCSGSTTAKKALVMAYKFEDRGYGISMTTQQKWRAKSGKGNVHFDQPRRRRKGFLVSASNGRGRDR
jgi:hypothetical protein